MPNNEEPRNELTYKERMEYFETRAKQFLYEYENPTGSEDRLEVCLIREGRRAVAKAKEEIKRLNDEIDRLKKLYKGSDACIDELEYAFDKVGHSNTRVDYALEKYRTLVKEMVGEG